MITGLYARLRATPNDPALHQQVAKDVSLALTTAIAQGTPPPTDVLTCFGQLLTPPSGLAPTRRPALGQEMAALAGSADGSVLKGVARAVGPELQAPLGHESGERYRHAFVIALILRRYLPNGVLPDDFSARHVALFPSFTPGELALPYSVLFRPHVFAANVREIVDAWSPIDKRPREAAQQMRLLSPTHVLWLAWMAARPLNSNVQWLRDYVHHASDGGVDDGAVRTLVLGLGDPALGREDGENQDVSVLQALREKRLAISAYEHTDTLGITASRSYMAVAATTVLASRAAPGPRVSLPGRRRPRIAVCVSGQLRGYRTAAATWGKLFAGSCEVETFVHTWRGVGNSSAEPGRQTLPFAGYRFQRAYRQLALRDGYDTVRCRLPELFRRLDHDNLARTEDVATAFGATDVTVEDDQSPRFAALTNQEKMHYKIWACHRVAREAGEFDLIVRIRPDLSVAMRAFRWRDLVRDCRRRPLLLAERGAGLHFDNLMMGDQFAVARPEVMDVYANTWDTYSRLVASEPYGVPTELTGHASLAFSCWTAGVRVGKVPIRFAGLQAVESLTSQSVVSALEADFDGTNELSVLLRAARQDAGQR